MLQLDHPKLNGLRPKLDLSSIKDSHDIGHHPTTISSIQFGAESNRDLFSPQSSLSPPKQPDNHSGLLTKLNASRFKLPVALLGLAGTLAPFAQQSAVAAVTPESEKLLKALESNDEELIATAFINLGRINERDMVPFLKKTLEKGANEEYTLSAALKATALVISKSPPSEKAAFIKLVKPYLLNVVVLDKDKAIRFMPLDEAKALKKSESETKIRDVRYQAAKTLGILADNSLQNQLLQAAQDSSLPTESRMLSLEALSYSTPSSDLGKELLTFFDAEKIADSKSDIMGKLVQILIRHDVKDAWPKVDKLIFPVAPTVTPAKTSSTSTSPASVSPMTTTSANEGITPATTAQNGSGAVQNSDQSNVMGLESLLGMISSKTPLGAPNSTQKAIIQELLSVKKPQHADTVIKLMTLFPDYFENDAFEKAVDYFQTIASTNHKELVSLLNVKNTEAIARKAMPKPTLYLDDTSEKKDEEKIKKHAIATRKLMLTFAVATRLQEAKGQFREIFNNPLESQSLRSLAMSGSAEIRDMEAVNDLMTLATDNTESDVLRSDALGAVMSLTTPPLGPNLKSSSPTGKAMNPQKLAFLKRYLTVYSQNSKFTQSFYQAETYNEIRDARKQLLRDSAPLAAVDELTQQIVAQKLKLYTQSTPMRQKMMASEEFKAFEAKMVEYVSKNKKADPLVRIMMLGLLGEAKTKDLKPVLEELVKDPLVRTDIPLLASSNDMLMPGHTRMMMANATRSSAITALGKSGDLDASKTLEKGLWDDSKRVHFTTIQAFADLGKSSESKKDEASLKKRKELETMLIELLPQVSLGTGERMDNFMKNQYVRAIDQLGGGEDLIKLMDTTPDTVLRRAIANGLLYNGKHLDNPKVTQHLLAYSLGVDALHKKGIDGKGVEIAILDGDYINDDVEGLKGKVVYPEWGRTQDPVLRESFHGETVASAIVGKKANLTYGIAPGISKIYSYAAWDDKLNAGERDSIEEVDGLLRSLDDIIANRISGKNKVSIVNISLGGSSAAFYRDEAQLKSLINKVAGRFKAGSQAGITFVVSSGNEGGASVRHHLIGTLNSLGYSKENGKIVQNNGIILVGAVDTKGSPDKSLHRMSRFSSGGDAFNTSQPHIVAPGEYLPLIDREDNGDINFGEEDGTSFSAPVVTGTLALMEQVAGKPLEADLYKSILAQTAFKLKQTPGFRQGPGELDIHKAVKAAQDSRLGGDFNQFLKSLQNSLTTPVPEAAPPEKK